MELLLLFALVGLASANGSFKVYHSIFGAPAVDVCAGTSPLVKNLAYLSQGYFVSVPADTYDIDVRAANTESPCTGTVVITQSLTIEDDTLYTIIAHGETAATGSLLGLVDNQDTPASGSFNLRFVHASFGNPAVDILVDGSVLAGFANISYGEAASATGVTAGSYEIQAVVAGTTTVVTGVLDITFMDGTSYSIYASGDEFTGSNFLTPSLSIDKTNKMTDIKVIHAVALSGAPTVDVYVNGVETLTDFEYKDVAGYVKIPSLQTTVDIYLAGTMTSVLTPATITPAANAHYTLVAHGGETLPIQLLVLADNVEPSDEEDEATIRFVHASAGSPNVDVFANGDILFEDIGYGETDTPAYKAVPKGTYKIEVKVAGTETVVVGPYKLKTSSNQVVSVYAVGTTEEEDYRMLDALPLQDYPTSAVLEFNAAGTMTPSMFVVASCMLALLMF